MERSVGTETGTWSKVLKEHFKESHLFTKVFTTGGMRITSNT